MHACMHTYTGACMYSHVDSHTRTRNDRHLVILGLTLCVYIYIYVIYTPLIRTVITNQTSKTAYNNSSTVTFTQLPTCSGLRSPGAGGLRPQSLSKTLRPQGHLQTLVLVSLQAPDALRHGPA